MNMPMTRLGRRHFLIGAGATAATVGSLPLTSLVRGALPAGTRRFVSLYCNGGWDVLLGLDPRHPDAPPTDIELGTDLLAAGYREPIEVTMGDTATLWGPTMAQLARHADVATVFRGVNMNTVAHPTGRAYVNTFMPPAGVVPRGDSIATRLTTASDADQFVLPNVSIGVPSRNETFAPQYTGIGMARANETTSLVEPVVEPLSPETQALLRQTQASLTSCVGDDYANRPADLQAVSRGQFQALIDLGLGTAFDFDVQTQVADRYGITNTADSRASQYVAATIWQLFNLGLATSVTAQFQFGLDTHRDNWATTQPAKQQQAFDALAVLLDDLREDDPNLDHTTVIIHSEFARTPAINGTNGRDHWFANSVLVFGGGLVHGVFGATEPDSLGLVEVDLVTGQPSPGGEIIRPEHIGATLAAAAGLSPDDFRVDPLDAWIA